MFLQIFPYIFKPSNKAHPNKSVLKALSPNPQLDSIIDTEVTQENTVHFNDGTPDTRLIPFEVLSRAFRHALISSSRANRLAYDSPKGSLPLRKSISTMLNMERAMHTETDEICIVRGSQMGIFLAARILTQPGDNVVFEELTYPPARESFRSCGANILSVGVDEHGLKIDELETLCRKQKIKAIYVTPHHQFPTTVMLTAERRLRAIISSRTI